jgi:hypothetical protein
LVTIHSERHYRLGAGRPEVWRALTSVERYRSWWPWLEHFDGTAFESGATWSCVVKPPLPYRLRFRITLDEVREGEAARARVDGDIRGRAEIVLTAAQQGCELALCSELDAAGGAAKSLVRWMPWVAAFGHDWVIDTGARQFRAQALGT